MADIFGDKEVVTKGFLADYMFQQSAYRADALNGYMGQLMAALNSNGTTALDIQRKESYVREAGWYFKTLAVQEIGKSCLIIITSSEKKLFSVCSKRFLCKRTLKCLVNDEESHQR